MAGCGTMSEVGGGKVKRNPRFEKNFSRGHNPRGGGAERSNNERRGSAKSATKSPRSGDGPEETTTAIIPRILRAYMYSKRREDKTAPSVGIK